MLSSIVSLFFLLSFCIQEKSKQTFYTFSSLTKHKLEQNTLHLYGLLELAFMFDQFQRQSTSHTDTD